MSRRSDISRLDDPFASAYKRQQASIGIVLEFLDLLNYLGVCDKPWVEDRKYNTTEYVNRLAKYWSKNAQ